MTITALSKFAKYAILVLLILNNVKAQWSQASGSSSVNGVGSYGNIGEYRVGNLPPSRAASVWFSYDFNNGQKFFWVFGGATRYTGSSSDQYLNDLWVYNGQYWAWLAGSQSTNAVGNYGTFKSGTYTTTPGARTGSIGWTILENSSPVHYLFGGYGADGLRNDLWRWNGIWTWMNGSSSSNQNGVYNTQGYPGGNSPGSRTESVSWTSPDSRMWLFGGYGYAASGQGVGLLNDLWYFNGVNWIWMDGSQTPNSGGTYGTVGTPSASNQPGGRRSAASAFSSDSCTFYLFGGLGYGLNSQYGMLNDLWSYNCNSGQWTWESGSSGSNPAATYGSQGTASVNYAPAGRQSASLVYKNGYLVLYGGVSYTAYYNDVWVFNTNTKTWAWMSGSPTSTQTTSTTIGSRRNAAAFVDNSTSNLWIYGGYGYNSANLGYLDSTWANSMTILAPMPTTTGTATTATTATTSSTTSATTATTSSTSATTSSTSTTTSSTTSATTSTTSSTSSKGTTSTTSATTGATTSTTSSTSSKGTTSTTSPTTGATTSSTTGSTSASSSLTSGTSSTTSGSTTSDTSSSSSSSTNIVTVTTTGGSTTANSSQGGGEGTTGTSSSPTTGDTTTTGGTNTSAGAITTPNSGSIPMNPVIIGSVAGAFVAILLILIVILVVLRRRRNAAAPPTDPERRLPPVPQKSVPIAVLSPVTSSKPSAQEMSPVALRRNSSYAPIRSESISSTTSFTRFASRNNSIGNGTPLNRPPPPPGRPPSARPGQPPPPIMPRRPSRGSSFSSTSTGYTIETHVDKYSVHYDELHFIKKIGKGSFGKVYLGEWEKMTVAVKICSTMDIAQINEFLEEAKLMMGMRPHPHVIQILGISTNGPHPAMILEYCSGGSLDKLVYSEQTMDPSTIVRIVHGIALGMHHLHRNNIIHRDLACRNILLSETNQPKIADFGLSRFLVVDDGVQTTQSDTLPLRWMAPESLRDRSYSYATDVWSFGILVSEIVNREPPHRTLDIITAAFRIRDEGMTPQLRDDCPSILRDLLQQCWYLDPEYRPSFEEICEVLKASEYVKTSKIPVEIVFTPEETSYM